MGAISLGKGSRSRVRDREKYRDNYDKINWASRPKTCLNCGRAQGRCVDPLKEGIKACPKWEA